MTDRFLFVRPPRPLWPFNGPGSAFWPPLAFASLAAALLERVRGLRVEILDAPALELGWRTLASELRRRLPTYVGLGEEAVGCVECFRLARLARELKATVIAGGCFFGHVAEEALGTGLIDVVVHGEGEETIVELIEALRSGREDDLARVRGISYVLDGRVVRTPARPPLADLDRLPFPAYDLLEVARYGARSRNHPRLAAIELGRGCAAACDFCVLWRQMGRFVGGQLTPLLRVKTPERLREEIRCLVRRYDRRYLGWVDPCWNAHPVVPGQVAEGLLRDGLRVGQSAWVRADALVRDEASGALGACVAAGLNEVYLGIERGDEAGLQALHKSVSRAQVEEALGILRARYPQVFVVGSLIYGLPGDQPADAHRLHRFSLELGLDQAFFIPLTPLPGTPSWRRDLWDATGERFRSFSFLPGIGQARDRARLEWALLCSWLFYWTPARIRTNCQSWCSRDARKRRLSRRLFGRASLYAARALLRGLGGAARGRGMLLPRWYRR